MNEKKIFPDYKPKISPDTISDYIRRPNKVYEIIGKIGDLHISKLNNILALFNNYEKKAKKMWVSMREVIL